MTRLLPQTVRTLDASRRGEGRDPVEPASKADGAQEVEVKVLNEAEVETRLQG